MPSVRAEITRTLQRLGRRIASQSGLPHPTEIPAQALPPPGSGFGHYRILRRIGAGGMGQVYLAVDMRLDRRVALKFLSPEIDGDADMLRRLQAEARTASALNHPNILTIYEIGALDGRHYIASEYIEGKTLRQLMQAGRVRLPETIDIACQIVSALAAAHQAGIVHRDLKPGNIMIRPDGYVKVIDFGLAKRTQAPLGSQLSISLTRSGLIVGTVYYMSPEQARGESIDHRTDIWSLGIILFEMLAGRRPFEGSTDSHVIVKILDQPAPDLPALPGIPSELTAAIRRALEKSADRRYQSAREFLQDLTAVPLGTPGTRSISVSRQTSAPAPRLARRTVWLSVSAVALLIMAAVIFFVLRARSEPHWFQIEKARQITFDGHVLLSAMSRDGKYLAYVSGDPAGLQTLHLTQINGANETVKVAAKDIDYLGLTFSPDNELYAVEKNRRDLIGRLYLIPLVGNASSEPLIEDIDGPVTFSPSGAQMAFLRNQTPLNPQQTRPRASIFVVSRNAPAPGNPIFSTTEFGISRYLDWSPKGNQIAAILFGYSGAASGGTFLAKLDLNGTEHLKPLPAWQTVNVLQWDTDARSLLTTAVGVQDSAFQTQVQQINANSGAVHTLTREVNSFRSLSLGSDGQALAATRIELKTSLWISQPDSLIAGDSTWAEAERDPNLVWCGAERILIGSLQGGYPNLWIYRPADQTRYRITQESYPEKQGACIPGSTQAVVNSLRSGQSKIWRYDPARATYTQLTSGPNLDEKPVVSPDGQWLVYSSHQSGTVHLYRMRLSGGRPELLSNQPADEAAFSPDGRQLLCRMLKMNQDDWPVTVLSFPDGSVLRTIPEARPPFAWAADGSPAFVRTDPDGISNIWIMDPITRTVAQATHFSRGRIAKFAWSPDGRRLACLQTETNSDVVLLSRRLD